MAAGMGSRYGGLKQIDPVGPAGEVVMDYSIFDALRAGFGRLVLVIRRDIEAVFREVMEPHFAGRIPFTYAYQDLADVPAGFQTPPDRQKPWGTAHAIYACRHAIREPFGVINADDFYGRESFALLARQLTAANPADPDYCLVGFRLRNTLSEFGSVARAICQVDDRGLLDTCVERTQIERDGGAARYVADGQAHPLTGDEHVSMNMWGFTPAVFPALEKGLAGFLRARGRDPKAEYYIPTLVDELIRAGQARVRVPASPERWFGVTYPRDKPSVIAGIRALIQQGQYPEKLWS